MVRGFGSDNHSGVHPEIWRALAEANSAHAPSYGTDRWSEEAQKKFKEFFGAASETFFVFNGTAANSLALKTLAQSYHSVICADVSHLNVDECAAPEFFFGGKLTLVPTQNGKIQLKDLESVVLRRGDQHHSQPRVLSLTQPTELGTVYSLDEIRELCNWAKQQGLFVHMDGARMANAAVHLGLSFREFSIDLGVDVISFGGTKNGLMFGEALIFADKERAQDFRYVRKQGAQLPSKTRFVAASFSRYLSRDLWKEIAVHECEMAAYLFEKLKGLPGIEITRPRQSNAVFAIVPKPLFKGLRDAGFFFYEWNEKTHECRLMTSWDTQKDDIDQFADHFTEMWRKLL